MKKFWNKKIGIIFASMLMTLTLLTGCQMDVGYVGGADEPTDIYVTSEDATEEYDEAGEDNPAYEEDLLDEDGTYTSKDEVALYINQYGHLPSNFVTKKEAREAGWDREKGNLAEAVPGKSIGGDHFGNFEGLLPEEKGREYYECDIDADKGRRGAKRIVFSNDGLIYYTEDHYESFTLLYGEE